MIRTEDKALNRLWRMLLVLFVLISQTACQGLPVKDALETLSTRPVCCTRFSEVQFKASELGLRQKFILSSSSPTMDLPEGRAFFEPLNVPPNARSMVLQALLSGGYLPAASYVDASIVVLNKQKELIGTFRSLQYIRDYHRIFPGLFELYFGARIALPRDAAYVIVASDPNSKRRQIAISEGGSPHPLPAAPIGTIAIIFE